MTRFFLFTLFLVFSFIPSIAQAACSNPAGEAGEQIYNADYKTMQFCDGTNWIAMKGGVAGDNLGDHNATQDLDMVSNKITNVTDPTNAQDAATKIYVDGVTGVNETDPKIGTLTEGKWCTVSGGKVVCTSDAPGGVGTVGGGCDAKNATPWGVATSCSVTCSGGSNGSISGQCPAGYEAHILSKVHAQSCANNSIDSCGCGGPFVHKWYRFPTLCIKN